MKIAVIGSGVSGLVAAYRLDQAGHRVTLLEAATRLGGHTHTVEVEHEGRHYPVDMGFIVFNPATYPRFDTLLRELEIDSQRADMGFSVRSDRDDVEYGSHTLGALFAQRRNLVRGSFLAMLRDVRRFHREASGLAESSDDKQSLGSWLAAAGYGSAFREHYLIPIGSSIWSSTPHRILDFPAREFVRFLSNHGLLQARPEKAWRSIPGGSKRYVDAIVARSELEVRTGCVVEEVEPGSQQVWVSARGTSEAYDRVVLGLHADDALAVLADPTSAERAVLGAIPYQTNRALLHADERLLPRRRAARKSWNYFVPTGGQDSLAITYDMDRLQRIGAACPLLVTLNPPAELEPRRVFASASFRHPVFDARSFAAQRHHASIDGLRGVHFCGAYWGFGFHEDGVRSALRVVERIEPRRSAGRTRW